MQLIEDEIARKLTLKQPLSHLVVSLTLSVFTGVILSLTVSGILNWGSWLVTILIAFVLSAGYALISLLSLGLAQSFELDSRTRTITRKTRLGPLTSSETLSFDDLSKILVQVYPLNLGRAGKYLRYRVLAIQR